MLSTRIRLTRLCACAVVAGGAQAAEYWVSPRGADANPGTRTAAFATLARAEAAVKPGDTVVIDDGVYHLGRGGLLITKSGAPGRPIAYRARRPGRVVLKASERLTGFEHYRGRLYRARLNRSPSLAVEDGDALFHRWEYHFTGPDDPRLRRGGWAWFDGWFYVWPWEDDDPNAHRIDVGFSSIITLDRGASHRVWEGLVFEHPYFGVKWADKRCADHVIRNCLFVNGGMGVGGGERSVIEHCTFYNLGASRFEHGVYDGLADTRIRFNYFERISGGGLHLYKHPARITACYNAFGPPKRRRVVDPTFRGMHVGVYAWGRGGHRIFRNLFYGGYRIGVSLHAPDCLLANNTIAGASAWAVLALKGCPRTLVINNLIADAGAFAALAAGADARFDCNLYAGRGAWAFGGQGCRGARILRSLADFQRAAGQDARSLRAPAAGFAAPERGDYRLRPDSPAVDAGARVAGVTDGFAGATPDIGAFERGRPWSESPGVLFDWSAWRR